VKNLNELTRKIYNSLNRDTLLKEKVIEVIKTHTNITLEPKKLFIKESLLEIEASPAVKNEISLKQETILFKLKENKINIKRLLYR